MSSEPGQIAVRRRGTSVGPIVVISLILFGVAPFFVQHLNNLWRYRPHYEFVPIVLVAFVWLTWKRWPQEIKHTWASRLVGWILILLGLAVLAVALAFYSPWAGAVAAVLAVGGLLLMFAGRVALRSLLPVWLLLWLIVPPPFRLDDQLIHLLQGITARSSSILIEFTGVRHLLQGNVFRLPTQELFVAEACSGIHSQLVLIVASVLLVIMLRRTWIHAILLIAISICLSSLVNIVRVASIVFVAARWDLDWSVGWQHEVLGFGLTLLGFLLLISADLLLAGLLAPVLEIARAEEELTMDGLPLATDRLSRLWNLVIACVPRSDFAEPTEDSDPPTAIPPAVAEPDAGVRLVRRPPIRSKLLLLVATAFGCLALVQVLVLLRVSAPPDVHLETIGTQLQENWLPSDMGIWHCDEYRFEERETGSDAGQFSHIWLYHAEDHAVHVSADFPFLGWHELTRCYTSIGWIVVSRTVRQDDTLGPFVEVVLGKPAGEEGHLYFSIFDGTGQPVEPRLTHWRGWRGKLAQSPTWALFGGKGEQTIMPSETTIQFQQFQVSRVQVDDEQKRETRERYLEFRRHFLEQGWGRVAQKRGRR